MVHEHHFTRAQRGIVGAFIAIAVSVAAWLGEGVRTCLPAHPNLFGLLVVTGGAIFALPVAAIGFLAGYVLNIKSKRVTIVVCVILVVSAFVAGYLPSPPGPCEPI
jgi:hypothetical protein